MSLFNWSCQCLFITPSIFSDSHKNGLIFDTKLSAPLGNGHRNSIKSKHSIISFVASLLGWRRPLAIIRSVITIIIDSINSHSCRTIPHVGVKCFKGIKPTIAHRDSSGAIPSIFWIIGVVTSPFRACPTSIFRSSSPSMSRVSLVTKAVSGISLYQEFYGKTSAAFDGSRFKVSSRYNRFIAAIANAVPSSLFFDVFLREKLQ